MNDQGRQLGKDWLQATYNPVFDATGTIRAVAGQAGQIDEKGRIVNGGRALREG